MQVGIECMIKLRWTNLADCGMQGIGWHASMNDWFTLDLARLHQQHHTLNNVQKAAQPQANNCYTVSYTTICFAADSRRLQMSLLFCSGAP
jgi:hypothetical protein